MGLDYAVYQLSTPLGLAALVLVVVSATFISRHLFTQPYRAFGTRRIALAYLAATFATLVVSLIETILAIRAKIDLGHIAASDFPSSVLGWTAYAFVIWFCLALVWLALVELPLILYLYGRGKATLINLVYVSGGASLLLILTLAILDRHKWSGKFWIEAASWWGLAFLPAFLVVALAFGAGLGLPLRRGSARNVF